MTKVITDLFVIEVKEIYETYILPVSFASNMLISAYDYLRIM